MGGWQWTAARRPPTADWNDMDLSIQNPALELLRDAQHAKLPAAGETVDRDKVAALAREFESMLILQMLRQMRESMLGDAEEQQEDFGLGATTLGDTLDGELARSLAAAGGFGMQKAIIDSFQRQQGPLSPAPSEPRPIGDPGAALLSPGVGQPTGAPEAAASPATKTPRISAQTAQLAMRAYGNTAGMDAAQEPGVLFPVAGHLSSSFGWRQDPIQGNVRFHGGVDFKAAYGQPVSTVEAGRVTFAGQQGGYGLTVVVDHGGGVATRYAHLSQLSVTSGEEIADGQPIGRVGSSGRSTGPHLHFEVVRNGQQIDPVGAAQRVAAAGFKNVAGGVD